MSQSLPKSLKVLNACAYKCGSVVWLVVAAGSLAMRALEHTSESKSCKTLVFKISGVCVLISPLRQVLVALSACP